MSLDLIPNRSQFPALQQAGVIFFDNPGGTQIAHNR
jgi:selenocysteine lyase/cysteine desulfurase